MVPVFDSKHQILGYIGDAWVYQDRRAFHLLAREPMPVAAFDPNNLPPVTVQVETISFRWELMIEQRNERRFRLDVLITDGKPEVLVHIPGFCSFVEYHGEEVDDVSRMRRFG